MASIAIALVTLAASNSSSSSSNHWTHLQITVRAVNGAALGSILPLSQSLLVEFVPATVRGQAFGLLGAGEKLAGTLSSASVVFLGESHWQYVYYVLGIASIVMGVVARYMSLLGTSNTNGGVSHKGSDLEASKKSSAEAKAILSLQDIVRRIVRLPAFLCLVAQGIFGGTPWDMMSYLLVLMNWRGKTDIFPCEILH